MSPGLPAVSGGERAPAVGDLRRLDWRFLLPPPRAGAWSHLVILGGSASLSDAAVGLGLARRVSRSISPSAPADALAILEDSDVAFEDARNGLSPGGVLYWEVRRTAAAWLRTTPRAIARRLRKAGLTPLCLSWPRPGFSTARMYLPIGPRGALRWYVDTLMDSGTPIPRAARMLLRLVLRAAPRIAFPFLPRYAVAAVAGRTAGPELPAPLSGLAPLLLLRGQDASRRVVSFYFARASARPEIVLKAWRLSGRNSKTEADQESLHRIRARLDPDAASALPAPLGVLGWAGTAAALENYVPGRPLSLRLRSWRRPLTRKLDDVRAVFDWVSRFDRKTGAGSLAWDPTAVRAWVDAPIAQYRAALRATAAAESLFEAVRERGGELLGKSMPLVWSHPDLTPANVHRDGRRLGIVDWSGADARLPLSDLLSFSVIAISRLRGGGPEEYCDALRDLLFCSDRSDRIVAAVRSGFRSVLLRLTIDPRFFPLLAVLHWVGRCLDCADRAQAVARGEPGANPHPGESYVEFVEVMASRTDELFAPSRAPWWSS